MIYDINSNTGIDFSPRSTTAEILQNVRTIISTVQGSIPLDRDFGVNADMLDKPLPVAQAELSTAIIMAIKKYEPRASVSKLSFEGNDDGRLVPKVQVRINE